MIDFIIIIIIVVVVVITIIIVIVIIYQKAAILLAQLLLNNNNKSDYDNDTVFDCDWEWDRCIEIGAGHGVTVITRNNNGKNSSNKK